MEWKRSLSHELFGDGHYLDHVSDRTVSKLAKAVDGKSGEERDAISKAFAVRREERKSDEARKWDKWQRLRQKFDGVVIGIDSKISVYGDGFSVRVLFGSDVTFGGKKKFLAENRKEFLLWVMHEIDGSKRLSGKIGDIRFYRPVEIVVLRANEVEVKFDVKGEVA